MSIEEDREKLAYHLVGTLQSIEDAVDYLELDPNIDWEDEMLTASVEYCQECGWWMNSWDLRENDMGNFVCDQCFPEEDED